MKKVKRSRPFPVSQRQLAGFLNVSPSLMNMSEGKSISRNLPGAASRKLADLLQTYNNQRNRKPAKAAVELNPWHNRQAGEFVEQMTTRSEHYQAKAKVLQRKLSGMITSYHEDMGWLNTIDHLLENFSGDKKETEFKWLENQKVLVTERLLKSDTLVQAKLKLQIEMAIATAGITKSHCQKLKKEIK